MTSIAPPKEFGLGVLFVHGLTESRRGSTLINASDALCGCLDRWITQDEREERERHRRLNELKALIDVSKGPEREVLEAERRSLEDRPLAPAPAVALLDARITDDPDDHQAPAHLTLKFRDDDGDSSPSPSNARRWCLAESWPAQDFQPPSLQLMTQWVLKIAPVIVLKHFAKTLRRRWLARPRGLLWAVRVTTAFVMLMLAPLFSLLAVVPPLIALVLATLPVPKLSAAVRKSSTRIGASIGDSYVLLESPARFSALVSRVERDLGWLVGRCDRVAIVALGQGAMVTHRLIQRGSGNEVDLYVTVGSGLRKVAELMSLRRATEGLVFSWLMPSLVLVAVGSVVVDQVVDEVYLRFFMAPYVLLLFVFSLYDIITRPKDEEPMIRAELCLSRDAHPSPPWTDVFASFDPLSNGPIFEAAPDWIDSREVWTNASTLSDHGAYWRNHDAFVMPLGRQLVGLVDDAGLTARLGASEDEMATAIRRRAWRVGWLIGLRFAVLAAALYAGASVWSDVRKAAEAAADATPDVITKTVETIATPFREAMALVGVDSVELLAGLFVFCAATVAYAPVRMLWSSWNRRDVTRVFRREPPDLGGAPVAIGTVVTLCVVSLLIEVGRIGSSSRFGAWFGRTVMEMDVFMGAWMAFMAATGMALLVAWVRRGRTPDAINVATRRSALIPSFLNGVAGALIVVVLRMPAPAHTGAVLQTVDPVSSLTSSADLAAAAWGLAAPLLGILLAPAGRSLRERILRSSTPAKPLA